ncbi:Uncharacterised protein [Vibrio cholerae]|nr:Uncharacterised protein [Vibrio cholerae]
MLRRRPLQSALLLNRQPQPPTAIIGIFISQRYQSRGLLLFFDQ